MDERQMREVFICCFGGILAPCGNLSNVLKKRFLHRIGIWLEFEMA